MIEGQQVSGHIPRLEQARGSGVQHGPHLSTDRDDVVIIRRKCILYTLYFFFFKFSNFLQLVNGRPIGRLFLGHGRALEQK